MQSKYTKGKWEWVNHLSSDRTHEVNKVMCGTVSICVIRTNNQEQAEANSRLIASAPELLEALEGILKTLPLGFQNEYTFAAKQAIKKAKLEQ